MQRCAASEANSFAIEASFANGPPRSVGRRIQHQQARRFQIRLAVGQHPLHALEIRDALVELLALEHIAFAASIAARAMPMESAATPMRPPASSATAMRKPSFSRPIKAVAGTRQFSKCTILVAEPVLAHFLLGLADDEPGVPASTRKQEMPFPFGRSGSVTAQTTKIPAYSAEVM